MGMYNVLRATLTCPRCGSTEDMEVSLYFGLRDLIAYRIGDTYRWAVKGGPKKGGRPAEGTCEGEGYAECPRCGLDFLVLVRVEQDTIKSAEPDLSREPYVKAGRDPRDSFRVLEPEGSALEGLGWTFHVDEMSAGVYKVTGRDRSGRSVEATGTDLDLLTEQCRRDALRIAEEVGAKR